MASRRVNPQSPEPKPPHRQASTPDGRENQLIALAADLAESRLRDGSATAAEVVHFLKLGSSRERLEQERIRNENALMEAKREAMAATHRIEALYAEAIQAMKSYSGGDPLPTPGRFDD